MKKKFAVLALAAILAANLTACDVGDTGLSEGELNQVLLLFQIIQAVMKKIVKLTTQEKMKEAPLYMKPMEMPIQLLH